MYEDNAWPQTAPINSFIPERKRPPRVSAAGMAFLTAGGAALLAGLLHLAVMDTSGAGFLLSTPGAVMVVFGLLVAVWAGILAQAVLKGRKWVLKPARWTGAALLVVYAVMGLLVKPGAAVTDGEFGLWLYALLAFVVAGAGVVALLGLLGKRCGEYFDPVVGPSPFQRPNDGQPPIGGYDADWVPPQQRG